MELGFLGNGSGFTFHHNNAFFVHGDDLVLIDLSMLNLQKVLEIINDFDDIYLCITHMHDDHVSGVGLFIQHLFYLYNKKIKIIVPTLTNNQDNLRNDFLNDMKIKGVNHSMFDICSHLECSFIEDVIPTTHSPELLGKNFGYLFNINGKHILYSGDTCNLNDFRLYFNKIDEFYVDVSVSYGKVHLKLSDVFDELKELSNHIDVYLMHLDDIVFARNYVKGTNVQIAELY